MVGVFALNLGYPKRLKIDRYWRLKKSTMGYLLDKLALDIRKVLCTFEHLYVGIWATDLDR